MDCAKLNQDIQTLKEKAENYHDILQESINSPEKGNSIRRKFQKLESIFDNNSIKKYAKDFKEKFPECFENYNAKEVAKFDGPICALALLPDNNIVIGAGSELHSYNLENGKWTLGNNPNKVPTTFRRSRSRDTVRQILSLQDNNQILVNTHQGVYSYHQENGELVLDQTVIQAEFASGKHIEEIIPLPDNNEAIIAMNDCAFNYYQQDGQWTLNKIMSSENSLQCIAIPPDDSHKILISTRLPSLYSYHQENGEWTAEDETSLRTSDEEVIELSTFNLLPNDSGVLVNGKAYSNIRQENGEWILGKQIEFKDQDGHPTKSPRKGINLHINKATLLPNNNLLVSGQVDNMLYNCRKENGGYITKRVNLLDATGKLVEEYDNWDVFPFDIISLPDNSGVLIGCNNGGLYYYNPTIEETDETLLENIINHYENES